MGGLSASLLDTPRPKQGSHLPDPRLLSYLVVSCKRWAKRSVPLITAAFSRHKTDGRKGGASIGTTHRYAPTPATPHKCLMRWCARKPNDSLRHSPREGGSRNAGGDLCGGFRASLW